jgi:hypothetical protein
MQTLELLLHALHLACMPCKVNLPSALALARSQQQECFTYQNMNTHFSKSAVLLVPFSQHVTLPLHHLLYTPASLAVHSGNPCGTHLLSLTMV